MMKKKGKISAFSAKDLEPDPPTSDKQSKEDQETILTLIARWESKQSGWDLTALYY